VSPAAHTLLFVLAVASTAGASSPTAKALVVNAGDAGPGSFRDAVDRANADASIQRIQFVGTDWTIALEQTVDFTGSQDLAIDAHGATLDAAGLAGGPALRLSGGGSLVITDLAVRSAPAEGIAIEVPPNATGTLRISLFGVDIADNRGHGILVNDQEDPSTTDGVQPNPAGSDAGLDVLVVNSRFARNGYSVSDRDGLRVNEGGLGSLTVTVRHSVAVDNAADGIEVDERGPGHALVTVLGSQLTGNGSFDPADLDDGFDVDEYDDGNLVAVVSATSAIGNFEEGFDFNENNAGDLRVDMRLVGADANGEEGVDLEEDDDFAGGGDLVATMSHVTVGGNGANGEGDAGLKIREKGAGDLLTTLDGVKALENRIGGISVREDADGSLRSSVSTARASGNEAIGLDFDENGAGDLDAAVAGASLAGNLTDLRADEASSGDGSLRVHQVAYDTVAGTVTPTEVP
jgi:hypothetical protein